MDNHGDNNYCPPSTSTDVENFRLSGHEKSAMSHLDPGTQPPPYTEQQHVGAALGPYPTQPEKYPTHDAYPAQHAAYPQHQPAAYAPQPGSYQPQQPGAYPHPPGTVSNNSTKTVVVTQPGLVHDVRVGEVYPDSCDAICCSCFVIWCCCCPLGLAALILAILSDSSSTPQKAVQKLNIANGLSIAGFVCGFFQLVLIVLIIST